MIEKYFQTRTIRNFSIAMVWINGGSNVDEDGKKGINKILSTLLARGCRGFDNLEFSEYINSHGAELNLEISEDGILLSLKSLNEHFDKLFPLIDLVIFKPLLLKSQFHSVKKTTLSSIKKDKENPYNITFEKWRKLVYSNHPYAYNPNGYEKDILNITYEDVLSEYINFRERNMSMISNNLRIKNKSNQTPKKHNYQKKYKSFNLDFKNTSRFASTHRDSNQIIMMLGNQTCPRSSNEFLPLKVLESHLSYGMSSLLFKLFREKNGLTYDNGVFNPIRQENSPFLIYLSVVNENAILAFKILLQLWKNLISSLISDKEINLAKIKLKSYFLISNQTLDEILQRRIQLIGYDLDADYDQICLNKIEDISSEDILYVSNKYFSRPFLSIYGNKKICNEINELWIKNF